MSAAVEQAVRVAARAVRTGRTPPLGSVRHGTAAAALGGCPCVRCDQLRADLADPSPPAAAEPGPATSGRGPVRGYLGAAHPLADAARVHCRRVHGPGPAGLVGQVACGACWERAIRADERLVVEFGLPADPPPPDRFAVDEVAVERAGYGDRVRLTDADRAELARRVYAGRVSWRAVERVGLSGGNLRAAAGGAR